MNKPNDPGLLVFDMDGTIMPSSKPVYEAIRRVFAKANLPASLTEKDVKKYLGFCSDEFYQAVTPEDSPLSWQDLRLRVRSEYISTLKECAAMYPGVKETLETLRKRG